MNKLSYYLLLSCCALLWSCDQDIDFPYQGKDRIQFQHYTVDWRGNRTYSDSTLFSFGLIPSEVTADTLKLPMEYLGNGSDRDRTYQVSIVADSTTAVEGVHYLAFNSVQTFHANKLTDTLYIVVLRDALSKDYAAGVNMRLELKLETTDDFDLGLDGGIQRKIVFNDFMAEPTWWRGSLNGVFGFYHPKKWKFLIEELKDEELATYGSIPYDQNSPEIRSYRSSMDSYLRHTVVIDDITGMRVTMNGLEPTEK
ncbi:MAG: DUF4843 domain-containing protein [Odoribacter sp.]